MPFNNKNNTAAGKHAVPVQPAMPRVRTGLHVEVSLTQDASISIGIGNCQNQGMRHYQEDSFGYSNLGSSAAVTKRGFLAVLSDGMGGLANGKAAADCAVQTAIGLFDSLNPYLAIRPQLLNITRQINRSVCAKCNATEAGRSGATLVCAYFYKNRIYWSTVGDSRLYCCRNGKILQMNEDHDYKNSLFREYLDGNLPLSAIESDPQKDSLVEYLGKEELGAIDCSIRGFRILPNDVFVLCSDGIYNGISPQTILSIVTSCDAQTAGEQIVQQVIGARIPSQDNMTVMVIQCEKK